MREFIWFVGGGSLIYGFFWLALRGCEAREDISCLPEYRTPHGCEMPDGDGPSPETSRNNG